MREHENDSRPHHRHADACEAIRGTAYHLVGLANAFKMTGNFAVSKELNYVADRLQEAADAARDAFSEEFADHMHTVQANSANVLRAVLAGVVVGRDDRKEASIGQQ